MTSQLLQALTWIQTIYFVSLKIWTPLQLGEGFSDMRESSSLVCAGLWRSQILEHPSIRIRMFIVTVLLPTAGSQVWNFNKCDDELRFSEIHLQMHLKDQLNGADFSVFLGTWFFFLSFFFLIYSFLEAVLKTWGYRVIACDGYFQICCWVLTHL